MSAVCSTSSEGCSLPAGFVQLRDTGLYRETFQIAEKNGNSGAVKEPGFKQHCR